VKGQSLFSRTDPIATRSVARRAALRAGTLLLAGSLLSACVTASMPEGGGDGDFQPSNNPITVDNSGGQNRLTEIARLQHPKILATYGGEYSDTKLERMVAKVVGNLTTVSANPSQTYRITILNSPNVNAFALPGGYLYVTRGLLALANDSAELAAVLAHEMGHVTANHGIQRQRAEEADAVAELVVNEVLGGSATGKVAVMRNKLSLAQFSRNQELEADVIGIRSSGQAGFDPYAAARFLQSMAAFSGFRSVTGANDASLDFLASHPNTPQRIDLALRHARAFGQPGFGTRDRDSYLAGIDGLLFGDTPEEGFVRGHTFLHPGLGVTFSVPQGFVIDNSKAAVTASGPGDMAIRFDGVEIPTGASLTDYLRSGWVAGLDESSVQTTTVNGNEAATAKAQADNWKFDVTVIRAGGQVYRLLTAAPIASTSLDGVARSVGGSFRVLSERERAGLKPLRVRVVTVGRLDTVQSLASRMAGVDRQQELFRVLNALGPTDTVAPGDKVKIVTDE
jgi:predicted Zn-dependent protease